MAQGRITFHSQDIDFKIATPSKVSNWIRQLIQLETFSLKTLNIIFCSDNYLLSINKNFLDHDYYTDIITFDNSDSPTLVEGDLFISIDRVRDNSITFLINFFDELCRVIIHGVLHLVGYNDKTVFEISVMRQKEDFYLSLRNF